jgi:hypothetical protein
MSGSSPNTWSTCRSWKRCDLSDSTSPAESEAGRNARENVPREHPAAKTVELSPRRPFACEQCAQSCRGAIIGLIRDAFRAATDPARSAAHPRIVAAKASVAESLGFVSNSKGVQLIKSAIQDNAKGTNNRGNGQGHLAGPLVSEPHMSSSSHSRLRNSR